MKKAIIYMMLAVLTMSMAFAKPDNGGSGSIWTTEGDCGDEAQDVNHYSIGDIVYVNGANFDAGDKAWDITGLPGGASGDPAMVVANGMHTVDETGAFCFAAYTVQNDDWGEYKVHFDKKQDNYRVNEKEPENLIPEFGTLAAFGVLAGAGVFIAMKRK